MAQGLELSVLHLENNPDDVRLVQNELVNAGYAPKFTIADDRQSFIDALDDEHDIILSGHDLPDFDALSAIGVLRSTGLTTPFIVVSGVLSDEEALEVMVRGAADYVMKDHLTRLGPSVEKALDERQIRAAYRRTFQELSDFKKRSKAISDNLPGIIYQFKISPDGKKMFTFISEGLYELAGVSPEEAVNDPSILFRIVDPIDRPSFEASILESMETMKLWTWEGRIQVSGETKWLKGCSRPERHSDGSVAWNGLMLDITARKYYEFELRQARAEAEGVSRVKSAIIENLSHEIRTPVTGIIGLAELLESEDDLSQEDVREYAAMIHRSGVRLKDTLNSVLDMASIEASSNQLSLGPVDVGNRVHEIVRLYEHQASEKGIELTDRSKSGSVRAMADDNSLDRVLMNLLSNAVKFTEAGEISVGVSSTCSDVRITVEDTGIGIKPEFMPKIFDEFSQQSTGLRREYQGAGLGLANARSLVEQMNGRIEVKSTVDLGSSFTVILPRVQEHQAVA